MPHQTHTHPSPNSITAHKDFDDTAQATGSETPDMLLDTISLYLHIPFCHAKCHYCDFNSYAGMLGLRERYVAALIDEIRLSGSQARLPNGQPRRCRTIFLGGGTPSLLTSEQVSAILSAARDAFAVDADAEITLEANPGTLEYGHLDELRAVGVNRLSMGAQSFDPALLRWMGRIHSPQEIETAFQSARGAGFSSVNLDFIYALPGQSLDTWSATLDRALALAPEHLSLYSLIVEEGTPLFRWVEQGRVQPADEDIAADMYELAQARLAQAGYHHYEISNWALPGHECRHNLTYWHNLPYIGLGAGAHGSYAHQRYSEARPIHDYIARVQATAASRIPCEDIHQHQLGVLRRSRLSMAEPVIQWQFSPKLPAAATVELEDISNKLEMAETAILGLRLVDGLDLRAFERRFGRAFEHVFGAQLSEVRSYGLLETQGDRLRLTERGRLLGNEVFERLLPEETTTPAQGEQAGA
ncbi:MAG TPA: radical SAM family heme chaperone HemW [Ktedonobacterales bacterium]